MMENKKGGEEAPSPPSWNEPGYRLRKTATRLVTVTLTVTLIFLAIAHTSFQLMPVNA